MSFEELTAQCVFLIIDSYNTTATAISYATYNLVYHPEAQDKLYEEAKTLFSSDASSLLI
jgi:cytochrome P450